ncbi:hypothetical protein ACFQY4_17165 [Catellatospora bangladeshensis]|uniref:hypothetical protein n=1 Tax=Catellatospora bangladeshensis TaxID=310355 RepID=UPI0036110AEC
MPTSDIAPPPTSEALAEARWQAGLRSVQQRLRAGRDRTPLVLPDFGDQHEEETPADADQAVPYWLRLAGAWGWRFLVLAAVGWVLLSLAARLAQVLVPLAIALLLAALLSPRCRSCATGCGCPPPWPPPSCCSAGCSAPSAWSRCSSPS